MDRLSVESNRAQAYFSYLQLPFSNITAVIKSQLEPAQMIAAARRQIQVIDPHQPIYNVRTLEQVRATSIAPERLNLTLLGLFATLALILAAIGLYGVTAYSVSQRAHEIGVRMSLGAQRRDVFKLIAQQGLRLTLIGVAIGLAGAFALTRAMRTLLFEVSAADPVTFAVIPLLIAAVALFACWIPARRATKVDPIIALRSG
jgi:putative ABC transport system permease protein